MPSGWESYYIVFLSALMALGLPAAFAVLSALFSKKRAPRAPAKAPVSESEAISGKSFNTRFFLAGNAGILLVTLILALIPCVGTLQEHADREEVFKGLLTIVSICLFAAIGLFYAVSKGDLSWLKSFRQNEKATEGSDE